MERHEIERLIYGELEQQRRFTQDFPVLPDVWIQFALHPDDRLELLLTPHNRSDAAVLARALRERLEKEKPSIEKYRRAHIHMSTGVRKPGTRPRILFNEAVVFAAFTFEELIRVAMPLTDWWSTSIATVAGNGLNIIEVITKLRRPKAKHKTVDPRLLSKMIAIIGAIECDRYKKNRKETAALPEHDKASAQTRNFLEEPTQEQIDMFATLLANLTHPGENRGLLYSISRNREAKTSVWRSRNAVKADAASRLFDVDTSGIYWAVLDTGIDATHPAFARWENKKPVTAQKLDENGKKVFPTRIVRTYDFLRLKDLLDPGKEQINSSGSYAEQLGKKKLAKLKEELRHNRENRAIDWDLLEPFLRIPHIQQEYAKYRNQLQDSHGTHVAGIIAANWPDAKTDTSVRKEFFGICPHLEIYDLRVLGPGADEFTVIAALQFVRHLNAHKDLMSVHGVNLSMAVAHDVANYACGRTPVCEECERVVANGVVVVSAAGNRGFNKLAAVEDGAMGDYRFISITDPGNAENIITVGSTHRSMPHNYGVSYFSSRGPTGDGRTKPDLVAPGERIDSCALNGDFETMDGTSMAAPHVSGAAAMLIARHRELMGQPRKVKEILCKSATDLGRETRFQGAGMVDVLRALQSV